MRSVLIFLSSLQSDGGWFSFLCMKKINKKITNVVCPTGATSGLGEALGHRGPCGDVAATNPVTINMQGGSNQTIVFVKNEDHFNAASPGSFDVNFVSGDGSVSSVCIRPLIVFALILTKKMSSSRIVVLTFSLFLFSARLLR